MVEEKEKEKVEENKKEKFFKIFAGILFIGTVIAVVIIATQTEISVLPIIIGSGILILVSLIIFFSKRITKFLKSKFEKKEEEIPEPITEEQVRQILLNEVKKMMNHIKIDNGIEMTKSRPINKNLIYSYKVNLLYKESFGDTAIFIINATYPKLGVTILPGKTSDLLINKEMNLKSLNPREDPDEEKRTETDLSSGKQTTYHKKTHPKKVKKEEKKEDLI